MAVKFRTKTSSFRGFPEGSRRWLGSSWTEADGEAWPVVLAHVLRLGVVGDGAVGVQSDNASPEKLKITAPNSYPRYNTTFGATFVLEPTPKTGRKRPITEAETRPNFKSKTGQSTIKIDANLSNHQLEHEK
ncbi:hypothetical protein L3X38_028803 [Prunus dulcis]|uniref:Uncharacterized protein n=1 Tax=Prunus dulcis TaxID=3755 RepID=A0AAD4Z1J8_PRUDU|nr:hypothetical protein L3X38_028803 [Prunus dulcis]